MRSDLDVHCQGKIRKNCLGIFAREEEMPVGNFLKILSEISLK